MVCCATKWVYNYNNFFSIIVIILYYNYCYSAYTVQVYTPRLLRCDLGTENSRLLHLAFVMGNLLLIRCNIIKIYSIKLYQQSFSMENLELNVKGV